jgi:hypothetical protein
MAPVNEVWQKPPVGSIKVNWDAAVDKARNRVGLGIITRDSNGQPVVMQCATRPYISDPAVAEALAAWTAVELSCKLQFQCIFWRVMLVRWSNTMVNMVFAEVVMGRF